MTNHHQGASGNLTLRLLLLAGLALSGVVVAACGSSPQAQRSPTSGSDAAVKPATTPTATGSKEADRRLFGDYDDDDDLHSGPRRDDGDNDDSSLPADGDNDSDASPRDYYDSDDAAILHAGHAASASDRHAIAALLKHYYALAAAGDGTHGCAFLSSQLRRTFVQAVGEDGPRYLRGLKSCTAILSRMFNRNHAQLSAYAARLKVAEVRIVGKVGLVILDVRPHPARSIEVIRERGRWMLYAPLDAELP
jgi:hypothetical protein